MNPVTLVWALTALAAVSLAVYFLLRLTMAAEQSGDQRILRDLQRIEDGELLDLGTRPDAVPSLSRLLVRSGLQRRLQVAIVRAGWVLRPSELVTISVLGIFVGWTAGYLLYQVPGSVAGALILGFAPWLWMSAATRRRQKALMLQLPDAVDLICASLRAGHGFAAALKNLRNQGKPPLSLEAGRVIDEMGVGLSLEQALDRMMMRTGQEDVALICTAVQVQARTGGNLADVLMTLGDVIRERMQLAGEIDALTAEGRMSALVLMALPPIMAFLITSMSPGWLTPLVTDPLGNLILGGGAIAFIIGVIVLNKIAQVDL